MRLNTVESGRDLPPVRRVLDRLSCVVVCSLPVGVKQLTLAHVSSGGISSILMRAGAGEVPRISVSAGALLQFLLFLMLMISFHGFLPLASPGRLYHDYGLTPLLLPGVLLLGPHRGLAVLHGGDGEGSNAAHPEALPVLRLG